MLMGNLIHNSSIISKNEKNLDYYTSSVHKIEDYNLFDSTLNTHECCFFYLYDGKIINSENNNLNKIKNENIEKIEEISFTNPYVKENRIRFYQIDFFEKRDGKVCKIL